MILFYFFLFFFLLLCTVLSITILAQESKSMGLGASFGGDVSNSLFGSSTADVLKKFTAILAFLFMTLCILLSLWSSAIGRNEQKPIIKVVEPRHDS